MRTLHRYSGLRGRPLRPREPSLREVLLGVSAFILTVAACLYAVAQFGS